MSNFKIDRFLNNLNPSQKTYGVLLVNEFRKNNKFKDEKFVGEGIACGTCIIKFSSKHLTIESSIELNHESIKNINKKLEYKNKKLKVIYSKNIISDTMKEIVQLYN